MTLLKLQWLWLQSLLFLKNPIAFIKEHRQKANFNSGVDALEKAVKKKALNQHELKLEMNAFYQRKKRSGKLNDFQLLRLLQQKFKAQIEATRVKSVCIKKGSVQLR